MSVDNSPSSDSPQVGEALVAALGFEPTDDPQAGEYDEADDGFGLFGASTGGDGGGQGGTPPQGQPVDQGTQTVVANGGTPSADDAASTPEPTSAAGSGQPPKGSVDLGLNGGPQAVDEDSTMLGRVSTDVPPKPPESQRTFFDASDITPDAEPATSKTGYGDYGNRASRVRGFDTGAETTTTAPAPPAAESYPAKAPVGDSPPNGLKRTPDAPSETSAPGPGPIPGMPAAPPPSGPASPGPEPSGRSTPGNTPASSPGAGGVGAAAAAGGVVARQGMQSIQDRLGAAARSVMSEGISPKGRRLRARKVRRVVRHIDPWSVLTFSVLFHLCVFAALLLASVIVWSIAVAAGTIENIENLVTDLGDYESYEINGDAVFQAAMIVAGIMTLVSSVFAVLISVVFNLISDLVGGIRVTVVEEEVVRVRRRVNR